MKERPRLGVAVLVQGAGDEILLGQRGKEPNYGKWVIPGGGVKFGESLIQAGKREILEETGLSIWIHNKQPIVTEIINDGEHRVIMFLQAIIRGESGELCAASDLLDARFFNRTALLGVDLSDVVRPVLRETGWLPR